MTSFYEEYESNLKKELKKRKHHIYRDIISMVLMLGFIIYIYFQALLTNLVMVTLILVIIYIMYSIYRLRKKISTYHSYMDDLHFEDGFIIKYSSSRDKEVMRIPLESIKVIYTNIKEMQWTMYIVYRTDEGYRAESFYKPRIRDKEDFYRFAKKNKLLHSEFVEVEEIQEIVDES